MLVDYSMQRPLKRIYWWFFRRFIRLSEYFIQGHLTISDNLNEHLRDFGLRKPIEHIDPPLRHTEKYPKIPHDGFNIMYYVPKDKYNNMLFQRWLYGYDIYEIISEAFSGSVNWILVDGSKDMRWVYPVVDFYLRPNRHDGPSRLRMECDIQEIPYYWTQSNPSAKDAIRMIERELCKVKLKK